jgi:hypothetical protein
LDKKLKSHEAKNNGPNETAPKHQIEVCVVNQVKTNAKETKDHMKFSQSLKVSQLLAIRWSKPCSLQQYLENLVTFLSVFQGLEVKEEQGQLALLFPNLELLEQRLEDQSDPSTDSVLKLKKAEQQVFLKPAGRNQQKYGLVLQGGDSLSQETRELFESFGSLEVEVRGRVEVAWWDSKLCLLKALVRVNQLPEKLVPSILNFQLRQRPGTRKLQAGGRRELGGACRVFLTEEQLFSLDWKMEKLYRDNTPEKSLSRQLTNFIKTVR